MRYCLPENKNQRISYIFYYITYCPGGIIIMKVTGMLVVSLSKGFNFYMGVPGTYYVLN